MSLCVYNLANDIQNDCAITGGVKEVGYIANRNDITAYTESGNTVSALTFDTGKKLYRVYSPVRNPYNGTNVSLEEGDVVNRFTNTVSFVILNHNDDTAEIVDNLANGRYVCILRNEFEGTSGESTYNVYGLERGLRATEITHDPYDDASAGGWSVTMTEEKCAKSEHFFYSTSLAATTQLLEGYCTPVNPETI